jgi:hypothetical protein
MIKLSIRDSGVLCCSVVLEAVMIHILETQWQKKFVFLVMVRQRMVPNEAFHICTLKQKFIRVINQGGNDG